ncbi:MAG: hypothetical protein FGM24_04425 [Candidatus Kapabacteria bacterium]|nr:hypothetical protein [Candidatus Kapabacteria bacterium]
MSVVTSGSLFKVNRMPLARYGTRTFLSDHNASVPAGLADRQPTPEQLAFVKALNRKFKGLRTELDATFRAYCGGAAGYVVRRYAPSCVVDEEDVLSRNRPIGMGPKGLERYFQSKYGMSWGAFLETPSDDLRPMLARKAAPAAGKAQRPKTVRTAQKSSRIHKAASKASREALDTSTASSGSDGAFTSASKRAGGKHAERPAASATTRTPRSSTPATTKAKSTRAAAAGADPTLEQAERDMAELKALLTKAVEA